ncbi:sulfite exporter TauE/SafE family protein [Chelatococcus sambhunathii]|uniref:Probable membrane transporter protein n=1 Tax=Chelatococcus sambhunathii TaxID=363953 RepID=A0ABU1DEI0_9HYPH|nr:sulfite exporter TauE/SafE family protein [Chelatococcus sambhunathii]MDR4306524.1 sulfite exporter TauE/SafE family protein [Chelatococcus sambhunathii]
MDLFASLPVGELMSLGAGLLVAGVITGVLAGLFGVGGGAVIVPVLASLFEHLGAAKGFEMQLAVGTSLAIIIPTSIRSLQAHRARGAVDMSVLRAWAPGVVVGCVIGAAAASLFRSEWLKGIFAAFALFMSLRLLFAKASWTISDELPGAVGMTGYGLFIGVISALMGIGGGTYGSLIMTLHNRPIHQAIATSAGLGAIISIPGAISFVIAGLPHQAELPPLSLGFVSLIGIALMAPVSTLVAPIGVRLAHGLTKRKLEVGFGLFLAAVSAHFLIGFIWR